MDYRAHLRIHLGWYTFYLEFRNVIYYIIMCYEIYLEIKYRNIYHLIFLNVKFEILFKPPNLSEPFYSVAQQI